MDKQHTPLTDAFRALGDATRFKLVSLLLEERNICVSELADEVNISVAGVSQQLKILEQANIIERVREGQRICYKVNLDDPNNKKIIDLMQANSEPAKS